ncbi:MAG: hypothetical protein BJ554DRAFT_5971, partial [Olpidium bornovanus]
FSDARLSVWNNCWSDVFDFNGPNAADVPNNHHSFLPEQRGGGGADGQKLFEFPLPRDVPEGLETGWETSVVPLTLGKRPRASNQVKKKIKKRGGGMGGGKGTKEGDEESGGETHLRTRMQKLLLCVLESRPPYVPPTAPRVYAGLAWVQGRNGL